MLLRDEEDAAQVASLRVQSQTHQEMPLQPLCSFLLHGPLLTRVLFGSSPVFLLVLSGLSLVLLRDLSGSSPVFLWVFS